MAATTKGRTAAGKPRANTKSNPSRGKRNSAAPTGRKPAGAAAG